jgi:hypothetical protein
MFYARAMDPQLMDSQGVAPLKLEAAAQLYCCTPAPGKREHPMVFPQTLYLS